MGILPLLLGTRVEELKISDRDRVFRKGPRVNGISSWFLGNLRFPGIFQTDERKNQFS